jgi:hypothetical protein
MKFFFDCCTLSVGREGDELRDEFRQFYRHFFDQLAHRGLRQGIYQSPIQKNQ